MSTRLTRAKRRASGSPVSTEPSPPEATQPGVATRKRRSQSRSSLGQDEEIAAAAAAAGQQEDAAAAAAAAAAATATPQGADAAGPGARPRFKLPRVNFSQPEAAQMQVEIRTAAEAAADARDKEEELGIARATLDELAGKVVRYMLFKNYSKPDVPVKRQEIVDLVQKDQRGARHAKKLPGLVLPLAAARLAAVFGLEMHEVCRQPAGAAAGAARRQLAAAAAAAGGGAGGNTAAGDAAGAAGAGAAAAGGGAVGTQTYVLRSMLPSALHHYFVLDRAEDYGRGLMVVVLGLLHLNGGHMDADELWRHLSQLGVQQEETHNDFGRLGAREVLTHMENARFVTKRSETNPAGGTQTLYAWGERAQDEFGDEQQVKQFIEQALQAAGGNRAAGGAEE